LIRKRLGLFGDNYDGRFDDDYLGRLSETI